MSKTTAQDRKTAQRALSALCDQTIEDAAKADAANDEAAFKARAETREALVAFHERLRVEPYTDDDRWHKVFRKGSPLEWFNPLTPSELEGKEASPWGHGIFDAGTEEDHAQRARESFRKAMGDLPDVDEWFLREDGVPF